MTVQLQLCFECGTPFQPEWVRLPTQDATATDLCAECREDARRTPDRFTVGWANAGS
jgi:hypothetical protein